MILHPAQKKIVEDKHRFRVVNAGRRFGKTALAVEELFFHAVMFNEANVAYVAPTYTQAREISWEMLKRRAHTLKTAEINESRLEMSVPNKYGTRSKIVLKGWESIESLRGQKYHFLVLDEVAMYRNFQTGWEEVVRPTLTDVKGRGLFISTPKGFNHWYDIFNKQVGDDDFKSFHFTTYENPHVPPDEIDKARKEITEDRFQQEYMAEFRKMEGLVYKEFSREKHIFTDTDLFLANGETKHGIIAKFAGVDFGYTNPTAILTVWKDSDAHYWVLSEWYKTGKTQEEITEYVKTLDISYVYPDPAEPDRIRDMERHGVSCRDVSKDVKAGIDSVRNLFKSNRLHIHKSCTNLIHELETYQYKEPRPGMTEPNEEPLKEADHGADALRYALHMQSFEPKAIQRTRLPQFEGNFTY